MRQTSGHNPLAVSILSAALFYAFTFLYIYIYQAPTLTLAQHILSDGVTTYHPLVGTILLCLTCAIIQQITHHLTHLRTEIHVLTYLPSFLFLAVLTSLRTTASGGICMETWTYWLPLLLMILFVGIVKIQRQIITPRQPKSTFLTSKTLSANLLLIAVMMILTAKAGNGDEILHRQIRTEKYLLQSRYADIADAEKTNTLFTTLHTDYPATDIPYLATDTTLTTERFIALHRTGHLADSLFVQPVTASASALLYLDGVRPLLFRPEFLRRRKSADYKLCAFLADCSLDRFAHTLAKHYALDSIPVTSLPRHYREALVLYRHTRTAPVTNLPDSVLDTDYNDMRAMLRKAGSAAERRHLLWLYYRKTYWYHYLMNEKGKEA